MSASNRSELVSRGTSNKHRSPTLEAVEVAPRYPCRCLRSGESDASLFGLRTLSIVKFRSTRKITLFSFQAASQMRRPFFAAHK